MKVYLVSSGEYSDFHIEGLFSTMEEAEKYRDFYLYDNVVEYQLDPGTPVCQGNRYCLTYSIETGKIDVTRACNSGRKERWRLYTWSGRYGDADRQPTSCKFYYFAKNLRTAHKIARDKVSALKAGSTLISGNVTEGHYIGRAYSLSPTPPSQLITYDCKWRVEGKVVKLVSKEKQK